MKKFDLTDNNLTLSRQLFHLSFPAMVSLSVQALYNIVDKLYIGNIPELSTLGLAALTAINPIMNIIIAIGTMFGVGGAVFYSILLGRKDTESAEKIMGNTCFMLAVTNIIFVTLLVTFFDRLAGLMGLDPSVMKMSKTYFFTIAPFSIFWAVGLGMNNFIRADGKALFAMVATVSGAVTNIILDALFVIVFRWGMFGVGLATGIGQFVSFCFVMWFFQSKNCRYKLKFKGIRFNLKKTLKIAYYGIPSLVTTLCNILLNLYIIKTLLDPKVLGDFQPETALAVQGIIFSLLSLLHIPIHAFCQGMQPLIGYNYGKKQYGNVMKVYRLALLYTTAFSAVICVLLMISSEYVVMAFDGSRQLGVLGPNAVRLWNSMMPLVSFELVSIGLFQAMGHGRKSVTLIVFRQLLALRVLIRLLSERWGIWGVFASMPIADLLTSLMIIVLLLVVIKDFSKRRENEEKCC